MTGAMIRRCPATAKCCRRRPAATGAGIFDGRPALRPQARLQAHGNGEKPEHGYHGPARGVRGSISRRSRAYIPRSPCDQMARHPGATSRSPSVPIAGTRILVPFRMTIPDPVLEPAMLEATSL